MVQIIIIKKEGKLTCEKITDLSELYKKCGFRKVEGFEKIHDFNDGADINIELWGKINGKGIVKNLYAFPTVTDKKIYGNCSLIRKLGDKYVDIDEDIWDKIKNQENKTIEVKPLNEQNNNVKIKLIKEHLDILKDAISQVSNDELKWTSENTKKKDEEEVLDITDSDSDTSNESDNSELKEETYLYSEEEEDEEELKK